MKKALSLLVALSMTTATFSSMSVQVSAAESVTVLTENFDSELVNGATYSFGEDLNIVNGAILLTNANSTANNYQKDLVSFSDGIGDAETAVDVSYTAALADKGKGQTATYFDTVYIDENGDEMFRIRRAVGNNWADVLTIEADGVSVPCSDINNISLSIVFQGEAGGTVSVGTSSASFSKGTKLSKIQIAVAGGQDYNRGVKIDNLTVATKEAPKMASFRIEYVADDDTVLKTVDKSATADSEYTATESDTAALVIDGVKYLYQPDLSTPTVTVSNDGESVLTLRYSVAPLYQIKASASGTDGTDLGEIYEGEGTYEGDSIKIPYPRYIVNDGKLYLKAPVSNEYNYSVTASAETASNTLEYELQTEPAVYYAEAEDILDAATVPNSDIRCSMGKGGTVAADTTKDIATLSAGTYKISTALWGGGKTDASQSTYTFKVGETELAATTTGSWVASETNEFTLTEDTVLSLSAVLGTSSSCVDYILITGEGTVTEINTPDEPSTEATTAPTDEPTATAEAATTAPTDEPTATAEAATTAPTDEPTAEPTTEPTAEPAAAATTAPAADGVFINEDFESYDIGTIIKTAGNDVDAAYDPVTKGSIIYAAGRRNNGSVNCNQGIAEFEGSKVLSISEDGYATSGRGVSFTFDAAAGIPTTAQIEAGKVLELSMDITSTQAFELTGFGTIPAVSAAQTAQVASLSDATAKAVLVPTKSADSAVIIKAVYDGGRLVSMTSEPVSNVVAGTPISVEASEGTKVMLWNSLKDMEPLAAAAVSEITTAEATTAPTDEPTATAEATTAPTDEPTAEPTEEATTAPTDEPAATAEATTAPTDEPTATDAPEETTAPVSKTSLPHLRAIIDPANNMQYVIITSADGDLISSSAAPLTATGFTGATFYTANTSATIDNLKIEKKDADTGILTVNVKDGENGVADATVTVGSVTATTGADGTATFALPNGTYTATASKSGYEHTQGMSDNDSTTVNVNSGSTSADLTLSVMSYIKLPDTVTIEDGQTFVAAPKTSEPSKTSAFTVSVLDQYGIAMTKDEYSESWSIYPAGTSTADPNVTIDENGVVSVAQGFKTENSVAEYDVTVAVFTDDRNQKVTKTIAIGNNDIIYYEPINWVQNGGTGNRGGSVSLANSVALPDISSVTINVNFPTGTEGQSTLVLTSNGGNLVGIQLNSDNQIKAWTAWTGNSAFNQSGDKDAFTNSDVLVEGYTKGTVVPVTFVIDKANNAITVSSGAATVSLPYTIAADTLTGFKFGQYRNYGAVTVSDITIQEPDNNYLAITGDADFAKVSGSTVTRTYALGQSVIVPDETFTWSVTGENGTTGVTMDNGVLSVADNAAAGKYTITAVSDINAEKTATLDVTVGDFETIEATNVEISGPQAYALGTDTTGTYSIAKAVDSFGDDVAALLPAATWTSSNTDVATITADGTLTVVGAGTTTLTATITNGTAVSTFTVPVTVAGYYVTADATGNTTTVDTSSLISNANVTGYQVTTSKDGVLVSQNVVSSAPTSVDTTGADKVEVAPVFEYAVGHPGTLGNLGAGYDIALPADTYNFVVTDTGVRCDVYVNKQILVNNILQGASTVNYLAVNDIVVNEGVAKITTADYPKDKTESDVNISIKVVKSPSIVNRTQKMYVLGDSLVCIYYNGGNASNNYQTGWGQVLQNYVKNVEVVDLGNSGITANGLYGSAFTQVLASAKAGDIMVLESGYNDRTYDTQEVMTNAVKSMISEAEAKGVKVVLVSPNASNHDYKADVAWTSVMSSIATETETDYIDLAKLSYDFLYGLYADNGDAVKATYNVSDRLHSTYHAANKWASIVASGLIDLGYGDVVNTDYTYTFTDSLGNTINCQAAATADVTE